jgi:hypothetical protein
MEFTFATELVHHSGVDLARIAYSRALGLPVEPVKEYRVEARMWHPIEEARSALVVRRVGELTLRRWLRSVSHRQHFPLWSWRDPVPSLHSLSRLRPKVCVCPSAEIRIRQLRRRHSAEGLSLTAPGAL